VRTITTVVVLTLMVPVAMADLTPIGDPIDFDREAGWAQRFSEDGIYGGSDHSFDFIGLTMISAPDGDSFQSPAMYSFSRSGWELEYQDDPVHPTLAGYSGPDVPLGGRLAFEIEFAGGISNPLVFDFVAFSGDEALAWRVEWGADWWCWPISDHGYTRETFMFMPPPGVPAPAAVLLGLVGVGGFAVLKRRCF
jgi:hypothetical protein